MNAVQHFRPDHSSCDSAWEGQQIPATGICDLFRSRSPGLMSDIASSGIVALFNDVNDEKLLQSVALIDRLPRRGAIDDLPAPLRPRLSRLQPPRPLTLKRLLAIPLEELLVPSASWRPGSLSLSREPLGTVQEIILGELDPNLRVSVERQVEACSMDDKAVIMAVGRKLWPAAAEALAGSVRNAPSLGDHKGRNLRQQLEWRSSCCGSAHRSPMSSSNYRLSQCVAWTKRMAGRWPACFTRLSASASVR